MVFAVFSSVFLNISLLLFPFTFSLLYGSPYTHHQVTPLSSPFPSFSYFDASPSVQQRSWRKGEGKGEGVIDNFIRSGREWGGREEGVKGWRIRGEGNVAHESITNDIWR